MSYTAQRSELATVVPWSPKRVGRGPGEGLRWLESENVNTCEAKAGEIHSVSWAAMLAHGSFFSGEAAGLSLE